MKESIRNRLEQFLARHTEIAALLATPEAAASMEQWRKLNQEYSQLQPLVERYSAYQAVEQQYADTEAMLADPEMRALAEEELHPLKAQLADLEAALYLALIPPDPDDEHNIFLEVRAGTGGEEAALFAADLCRMYLRYAERQRWQTEILSESWSGLNGYKEVVVRISGKAVYARLKFESGAHRVQRVPETEAQGRIHTSACTVAVLPEVEETSAITINAADLKVDTYRASGAGGQHINKTDSAIRITHLPTGVVVECQDERSQHKNRARAMSLLQSRLLAAEREKQQAAQAESRKLQVGSGDRSERIRTYNFPQGRVTDHRINLTLYRLPEVIDGDLDPLLEPLRREHQTEQLASLGLQM